MFCCPAQEARKDVGLSAVTDSEKDAASSLIQGIFQKFAGSTGSSTTIGDNGEEGDTFTLYLVRHGEASHNVEEKSSQRRAKEEAIAEGLDAEDPEVKRRMKEAREQVLQDETLYDAPLSDMGKGEAQGAHDKLEEIFNDTTKSIPKPTQVLVSPLQRTLQTAAIVFPDHSNIKVREEIRERDTGRPPDIRSSTETLMKRKTFDRFSMSELQKQSVMGHDDINPICKAMSQAVEATFDAIEEEDDDEEEDEDGENEDKPTNENNEEETADAKEDAPATATPEAPAATATTTEEKKAPVPISLPKGSLLKALLPKKIARQYLSGNFVQEDETMLRERTLQLFKILRQSTHRSVAIVSHKGYLRGLERGPFGRTVEESPEFKNCEVRVYRISFADDSTDFPQTVERVV